MPLSYDTARCQGHPIQQCQDCQRKTETKHHPYRQAWMVPVLQEGVACDSKIKEVK